ncbi:thioredoxin family protein [Persephonella sp.]
MARVIIEILNMRSCSECFDMIDRINEVLEELSHLKDEIKVIMLDLFEDNSRVVELGMYQCPALAINGILHYVGTVPEKMELKNLILTELSTS